MSTILAIVGVFIVMMGLSLLGSPQASLGVVMMIVGGFAAYLNRPRKIQGSR